MNFPEPEYLYRSHVVPTPDPLMSVQGDSQSEGFSLREKDHVIVPPEHQKEVGVKILTHSTGSAEDELTKKDSPDSEEVNLPSMDLQSLEMAAVDSPKIRQMVTCRKNQQWRKIMGSGERTRGGKRVLALRADVMNKNFFRAIRRECKAMFDTFIYNNGFTNSRSKRIFRANLRRFSENLLEDTPEQLTLSPDFKVEDFRVYIGILLNICVMKRLSAEDSDKVKCAEFNDLLYSYSHKKFYEFVTKNEMSQLIKIILEKKGMNNFIKSHPTLSVKEENYMRHIQRLVSHI